MVKYVNPKHLVGATKVIVKINYTKGHKWKSTNKIELVGQKEKKKEKLLDEAFVCAMNQCHDKGNRAN